MATPFLGEIRLFSFGYAPHGWAECNGQLMSISQNTALFSLLGTFYGGDGRATFGLPNLQGRVALHQSPNFPVGTFSGETSHTLTLQEMPVHSHELNAAAAANTTNPENGYFATPNVNARLGTLYGTSPTAAASSAAIQLTGGGSAHANIQPSLVMNYSIALQGVFPSRT